MNEKTAKIYEYIAIACFAAFFILLGSGILHGHTNYWLLHLLLNTAVVLNYLSLKEKSKYDNIILASMCLVTILFIFSGFTGYPYISPGKILFLNALITSASFGFFRLF